LAYLVVLCGNEGGLEAKIKLMAMRSRTDSILQNAPKPAGRTDTACKRMIERLEKQFKKDIARMKEAKTSNGQTTNKRKNKNDNEEENGINKGAPKKNKATPYKNKNKSSADNELMIKEEIPEEEIPEYITQSLDSALMDGGFLGNFFSCRGLISPLR
ncbi:hypothetical protein GGP41_006393, partial [Bipolaris sorokiniana]